MVNPVLMFALIGLGFIVGTLLATGISKLESKKIGVFGVDVYTFLVETFYFTSIFSIPVSGNIPLFILISALFIYSLYGKFGADKLEPLKPEDKVFTKWYSRYP